MLACCKLVIRRLAQVGDFIVGLEARDEHVIFAMQVASGPRFDGVPSAWPADVVANVAADAGNSKCVPPVNCDR
jgi:hypothetical protein